MARPVLNLVDKSLVLTEERGGSTWFALLGTIRLYASEKLRASGEEANISTRHRDWYLQLAERFEVDWRSRRQRVWLEALEREHANLRAALRGCIYRREIVEGLRLGSALYRFWEIRGHVGEGRAWLAELLALAGDDVPAWVGSAQSIREAYGASLVVFLRSGWEPMDRAQGEERLAAARAAMPSGEFDAAWAAGRAMSLDEAVDYALAEPPQALSQASQNVG